MKKSPKILLLLATFISISCDVTNENLVIAYFDKDDKYITLQTGTDSLISGMKQILLDHNWFVSSFNSTFD